MSTSTQNFKKKKKRQNREILVPARLAIKIAEMIGEIVMGGCGMAEGPFRVVGPMNGRTYPLLRRVNPFQAALLNPPPFFDPTTTEPSLPSSVLFPNTGDCRTAKAKCPPSKDPSPSSQTPLLALLWFEGFGSFGPPFATKK